jgi:hypothetical protein
MLHGAILAVALAQNECLSLGRTALGCAHAAPYPPEPMAIAPQELRNHSGIMQSLAFVRHLDKASFSAALRDGKS